MKDWKRAVSVLEELLKQYFTPHQTHEPLAIKLHLLAACLKRAGEWHDEALLKNEEAKSDRLCLEPLIKNLLRGCDPHGLPLGMSHFVPDI